MTVASAHAMFEKRRAFNARLIKALAHMTRDEAFEIIGDFMPIGRLEELIEVIEWGDKA